MKILDEDIPKKYRKRHIKPNENEHAKGKKKDNRENHGKVIERAEKEGHKSMAQRSAQLEGWANLANSAKQR